MDNSLNYNGAEYGRLIEAFGCDRCQYHQKTKRKVVNGEVVPGITLTNVEVDGPFHFCALHEIGSGICEERMIRIIENTYLKG